MCDPFGTFGVTVMHDRMFAICMLTNLVYVYDSRSFDFIETIVIPDLIEPHDILANPSDGTLYVSDARYYGRGTEPRRIWQSKNSTNYQVWTWWPRDPDDRGYLLLTGDANTQNLATLSTTPARLQIWQPNGVLVQEILLAQHRIEDGSVLHAAHITGGYAVSYSKSNVYSNVDQFDSSGTYLGKSVGGTPGSGDGQFREIYHMAVDKRNHIFMADMWNSRLLVLNGDFTWDVITGDNNMHLPLRLSYDADNDHMFVGHSKSVSVYKMTYPSAPEEIRADPGCKL
jgi:hypothetical protein